MMMYEGIGKRVSPIYRASPLQYSARSGYGYSLPSPVMGTGSPRYFGARAKRTSKTAFSFANSSRIQLDIFGPPVSARTPHAASPSEGRGGNAGRAGGGSGAGG